MKQTMEFMLEQQAKHESEIQDLRAVNKTIQENQKQIQESQQALIELVARLAVQNEQEHNQLSSSITAVNTALIRLEIVVEKDKEESKHHREETKTRLDRLEAQAEKDRQAMASSVDKLVNSISNVHRRVSHLEDQKDQG